MKAGDAEGEVGQASSGLSRQPRLHCVLHCAQLSLSCPQAPWAAVGVGKGVLLPGSGSWVRWVPGTAYPEHQQGGECGCAGWHSLGTVTPQQFCFASPALGNHQGTGLGAIARVDRRIASPTAGPRKREGNQANQDLCALLGVAQGSWCAVDITVALGHHRGAPQRLPLPAALWGPGDSLCPTEGLHRGCPCPWGIALPLLQGCLGSPRCHSVGWRGCGGHGLAVGAVWARGGAGGGGLESPAPLPSPGSAVGSGELAAGSCRGGGSRAILEGVEGGLWAGTVLAR